MENQKKDGNLGDSARGQADSGSAAVYTMDRPGPVIFMYVCVGTVSHPYEPTDPLVVIYIVDPTLVTQPAAAYAIDRWHRPPQLAAI